MKSQRQEVVEVQVDWRLPEHRRGVFQDFYEFHTRFGVHPGLVYAVIPYLRDRYDWDDEQLLWFAFLNGNTQHPLTSLLLHRRGSRPADADELLWWYADNRTRLGWDTDRRYHRRALPQAMLSYLNLLSGRTQRDYWTEVAAGGWPAIWKAATSIATFGRLSAWSLCDYLHICGVPINCAGLMLEDRDGSRSHRNGLAIVSGMDHYDWHASNPAFDGRYPRRVLTQLAEFGAELLDEAQQRAKGQSWARDVNYLTLESALCTYKSWHRPNRRYAGVYADMMHDRIVKTVTAFPEEDLTVFWDARRECLPAFLRLEDRPGDPGLASLKQNWYRETGQVPVLGHVYPRYWSDFDTGVEERRWGVFR
jgi:hypothetical protein